MKKSVIRLCLFLGFLFCLNTSFATTSVKIPTKAEGDKVSAEQLPISVNDFVKGKSKKESFVKRFLKKRLIKKVNKRMNKLSKKAAREGLLSDSRIYLGLLLILGGLLVGLILASWLSWIGYLATIVGLVLIILGLLDMA